MNFFKLLNKVFIFFIKFYQNFISPFLGPKCRYYPTCSHYSLECFKRFSFPVALWYSSKRICKCNPLFPGGVDLVPGDKE